MEPTPIAQMCANARAWLAEAGFPALAILENPAPCSDHCFLECSQKAVDWADLMMDRWTFATRWSDHQTGGYPTAIGGWREQYGHDGTRQYRWAAQMIHHRDRISGREYLELDFDSHSPNQGLYYAIAHGICDWLIQKIRGSKTSPFTVAKKRGWSAEENV